MDNKQESCVTSTHDRYSRTNTRVFTTGNERESWHPRAAGSSGVNICTCSDPISCLSSSSKYPVSKRDFLRNCSMPPASSNRSREALMHVIKSTEGLDKRHA